MTDAPRSFDPIWGEKYAHGHAQQYPWDVVASFCMPGCTKSEQISSLEVGCGTGSNLWFAAREGFLVAGAEASKSAIAAA